MGLNTEEINTIWIYVFRVFEIKFDDSFSYKRKFIAWQGMWNYKYPGMWTMLIEEMNSKADEVIPVSSYKTPAFRNSPLKLLSISRLNHSNFISTECIYMMFSEYFCNLWTEVLIKVVFQRLPLTRKGYFS